jgi:hypothetical protein
LKRICKFVMVLSWKYEGWAIRGWRTGIRMENEHLHPGFKVFYVYLCSFIPTPYWVLVRVYDMIHTHCEERAPRLASRLTIDRRGSRVVYDYVYRRQAALVLKTTTLHHKVA